MTLVLLQYLKTMQAPSLPLPLSHSAQVVKVLSRLVVEVEANHSSLYLT